MGGGPDLSDEPSISTRSSGSIVEIVSSRPGGMPEEHLQILFAKSKVFIHPTHQTKDNLDGYLSICLKKAPSIGKKAIILLAWIPASYVDSNHEAEKFVAVEQDLSETEVGDSVLMSLDMSNSIAGLPKVGQYAFSIPISSIYSLQVDKPTLVDFQGSITINLFGGSSLSTLYFHDDLSASTVFSQDVRARRRRGSDPTQAAKSPSWGGEALLSRLRNHATVVRSTLQPNMYLVNPSRADVEVHSNHMYADLDEDDGVPRSVKMDARRNSLPASRQRSILHESMSPSTNRQRNTDNAPMDEFTFKVLNTFSKISRSAKQAAKEAATNIAKPLLSHNLAKPILPHLPPPVQSLVHSQPPEFAKWQETSGTHDFNQAAVFLAKWAKVVSEEGERLRREEVGASADGEEASALGAWEILASTYNIQRPRTTRAVNHPIVLSEWQAWLGEKQTESDETGRLLISQEEACRRIFQRGLAPEVRKEVWPYLLGVYPWDATAAERLEIRNTKRTAYEALREKWSGNTAMHETEEYQEEMHRVEIDCRRTDRSQPYFCEPSDEAATEGDNELSRTPSRADYQGGQSPSNKHVRALQDILMTYNQYEKELGYVQGMSDLCSPIYILMEGDPTLTFWCFAAFMERMKPNFLRDQSGMKAQLSALQRLIAVMDPTLYTFLEKTDSMNLFFCFRWILISFKREFSLDDIYKIWENLLTNVCGKHFHLFVALAILQAHRDVIMRYLNSFDEVLKYINELSMTMDAEPMLCQAEILYKTLQGMIDVEDRNESYAKDLQEGANPSAAGLTQRKQPESPKLARRSTFNLDASLREVMK